MELETGILKGKIVDQEIFDNGLKYYEGQRVIISVKKFYETRTLNQNDALWRWNTLLAEYTGNTPNEMHYLMLGEIFGWKNVKIYDPRNKDIKILLVEIRIPNKTSKKMTTKEMSDYVILYFNKALELFNYELPPFGWEN